MQPSTDAFATELRDGAKYATRLMLFLGDKLMADTFYGDGSIQYIPGGSCDYDRLSDTRSSTGFQLIVNSSAFIDYLDPTRFPEVLIQSGIYIGSDIEWIDMGTFGLHTVTFTRDKNIIANCQGVDRSGRVRDNPWRKPFQIASGTDYYAAMKLILDDRAKGFTPIYNLSSNALTTPTINNSESDDPWGAVLKLAEAVGAEVYFDRQGAVTAMPVPDPLLISPSLVIGPTSGVQIAPIDREVSNREVFNGVICRGEAPWLLFPISGEVWDEDPLSPSYRYGSFGEKPKVIGDTLASTDAQCLAAATAEFKKIAGVMEGITFDVLKDPRLEVGDIIESIDDSLQIVGRYVLDSYNYPLGSGVASGRVRRKR